MFSGPRRTTKSTVVRTFIIWVKRFHGDFAFPHHVHTLEDFALYPSLIFL